MQKIDFIGSFSFCFSLVTLYRYLWYIFFFIALSQLSCFFLYYLFVLHCMVINILREMKKCPVELMTQLPCNMTHQLVGHWWIRKTNVMNYFSFSMNSFSFPQQLESCFGENYSCWSPYLLFITNSFSFHTYYKTTSWRNSTVFNNFMRKCWRNTSSAIDNNDNDVPECILHFLMRQVLQQQYQYYIYILY